MVDSIIVKRIKRPLKRIRAKEYATKDELKVMPMVEAIEMIAEFVKNVVNETPAKPRHPVVKLSQRQYRGISVSAPDTISTLVLSDPETIQSTGYTITNPKSATSRW